MVRMCVGEGYRIKRMSSKKDNLASNNESQLTVYIFNISAFYIVTMESDKNKWITGLGAYMQLMYRQKLFMNLYWHLV
jgi:hypothetical protein